MLGSIKKAWNDAKRWTDELYDLDNFVSDKIESQEISNEDIIYILHTRLDVLRNCVSDKKVLFSIEVEYQYIINILKKCIEEVNIDDVVDINDLKPALCRCKIHSVCDTGSNPGADK
jgi:hypothetical protein